MLPILLPLYIFSFCMQSPIECLTLSNSSSNKENMKLLSLYKDSAKWTEDMRSSEKGSESSESSDSGSRSKDVDGEATANDRDRVYW